MIEGVRVRSGAPVVGFVFSEGPALYPGEVLWWLLFACWILALIHADLRYRRVPNRLVVAGLAGQLLWLLAALLAPGWAYPPRWSGWLMALAGFLAAVPFLPLWARRLMGAGDIKAIAVLGLLLGFAPLMVTLALASVLAGLHGLLYLAVSRVWALSHRARQIPYAAYLGLAAVSAVLIPWNSPWYSWCSSWCFTGS
ncbi:A24 family peptidase [Achromobacter insolitus]|uniref:A24 family peptidase n=1 Tax=Achromobacter insolitus TaxID=217204 RepID=UPI001EEF499F|nr:A24 family peptidase [Achromobacter insolitus]